MKKLALSLLFAFVLTTQLTAQLNMTRTTYTAPYLPISLPAATLSTATGDDVAQSAIAIGFTFNYLGTNYTDIGLNTNGVASFETVMSGSGTNNNLFAGNAPDLSLAPWWDNLYSDTVLYQLQGSPGSQTFTIQWTNTFSYSNTATQMLNFQVILHETTNEIEFAYGQLIPGITAANESASIGIEGATGGAGDYLDAVTGSAFTSNGMINAFTQWPAHNFRFTPGAPAPVAGGTYTVGVSGNYFSLSEAIADINHRGISGSVVLSLIDATYDVTPANGDNFFPMLLGPVAGTAVNSVTIAPASGTATISSEGALNGNCGNAASNNVISNANEPIFAVVGGNFITLQNLNLTCSSTGAVDRGLQVVNSSSVIGTQNSTFENITVSLNRANTGCYGISQSTLTVPTAASGANSYNTYTDLNISNVYTGIYLSGNAAFPDMDNVVGTSSPALFNSIGGAVAGDIGSGTGATASYGIRANNQGNVTIHNNEVRNVSHAGTSTVEGIVVEGAVGNNNVYMNKVHDIACTGTNSTANIAGIRVNLAAAGTNTLYVFNNFVYAIGSAYSGAPTGNRAVKGIYAQSVAGGNGGSSINVDFNSVYLDNSASPNLSGTCFESGTIAGPMINVRNNVFANFTAAQAGTASHYAMATANATAIGNTGSISDYNDLYINDPANGFTGIGQATTYPSLANWQIGMTQDANSVAADPGFFTATDLHVTAVGLNNTGNITGITWITTDIDNETRLATPDIGADEFTPALLDAGITAIVAPMGAGCHTSTEQVTVTLRNYAGVALDFTVDPVTVTVNVTGALTQTLNFTINNNSLNGNVPLIPGGSMSVPAGTINMSAIGTYTFDAYSTLSGDGNALNDTMTAVSLNYTPGTVTVSTDSVCAGSSVTVMLNGSSNGGTIQWQSSTDGGSSWNNETGTGFDSTVYAVIPAANTLYQAVFCGLLVSNNVSVTWLPFTAPVAMNDTVCGPGAVILSATAAGVINWYADSTGGAALTTGTSYSTNVSMTDTFYVSNTTGNVTQGVGLFDNSAGGGMSASVNNLIFDVFGNCTLTGVFVYPAAAGNVTIDLRDNANALINTATVAVTAADINQRTFIPLNFTLSPGTGMQLVRDPASVNLWRNNVGVNYPYSIPGFIDITGSTAGAGFYYYFYDWQIAYGCESPRVPLTVVVNAPPVILLSAGDTTLCLGDSTTLSVSSVNTNYTYTWTPGGSLNTTTGNSVIATPVATTMYTVNAMDSLSGCHSLLIIRVKA